MSMYRISHLVPRNIRIINLPPTSRKDMLVLLIPSPLHYLARMRFVFLDASIIDDTYIIMHVEVEEGTALATGFGDDQVVET